MAREQLTRFGLFGAGLLGGGLLLLQTGNSWAQAPQPSPSTQTPSFPAGIELVTVDVVVLDEAGNPVPGLTREEFKVAEDGKPQTIASFEAVVLPESAPSGRVSRSRLSTNVQPERPAERSFVVVFDNVHMAPDRAKAAKEAVREFLKTGLREGDLVTLVPTSGGAWWSTRMPDGYDDLVAALERLQGERSRNMSVDRISDYEAMRLYLYRDLQVGAEVVRRYYEHRLILEPHGGAEAERTDIGNTHPLIRIKAAEVYHAVKAREQATLGTLERVAQALAEAKGRKSVILVSEGFVHEPSETGFKDVVTACRRANVAIYFLDARGLSGLPATADAEIPEQTDVRDLNSILNENFVEAAGAQSIAVDSGGFMIKNRNDLAGALRQIAEESSSYFLIGYQSTNAKRDGKFRKIKVETSRPDVEVRARRGYYAPSDEELRPRDPEALDPDIRQAIDSPFFGDSIPLRMTSYVLGQTAEAKASVLLAADADPRAFDFTEADGRFNDVLETYLLVSSRDTGENFHKQKQIELSLPREFRERVTRSWLPIVRDFELPPGTYQARLLVRDRQSGRVGTVRHEFEVPEPTGLRISTPILTDTLQPAPDGNPMAARPVPLARRSFAAAGRLFYVFQVFGAGVDGSGRPQVSTGYVVRCGDGSVFTRMEPRPISPGPDGGLSQMLVFSLEGAEPGEYELVLFVRDDVAGKTLEVSDPFSITARPGLPAAPASGGAGATR